MYLFLLLEVPHKHQKNILCPFVPNQNYVYSTPVGCDFIVLLLHVSLNLQAVHIPSLTKDKKY